VAVARPIAPITAQLAGVSASSPPPAAWPTASSPIAISSEPLAPAVWGGDQQWTTMVRWVFFVLMHAEAHGASPAPWPMTRPWIIYAALLRWNEQEADALAKSMG
jgi:hypothetical protein